MVGVEFSRCVGLDSGCVHRLIDIFVHDLISANQDSDSENMRIDCIISKWCYIIQRNKILKIFIVRKVEP